MRRLKNLVGCLVATVLLALIAMSTTSCNRQYDGSYFDTVDSTEIAKIAKIQVREYLNPEFNKIDNIMDYHEQLSFRQCKEQVFAKMSSQTVFNCASIVLARQKYCSVLDIVDEYERNRSIYDNLPEPESMNPPAKGPDESVSEKPDTVYVELAAKGGESND